MPTEQVPDQQQREAEIRARAEAATPGPWSACGEDRGGCQCAQVGCADGPVCDVTRGDWGDTWPEIRLVDDPNHMGKHAEAYIEMGVYGNVPIDIAAANQAFIAHAREDIPFLLGLLASREVEADARVAPVRELIEEAIGHADRVRMLAQPGDGPADSGRIYDVATEAIDALDDALRAMQSAPIAAPAEEGGRA